MGSMKTLKLRSYQSEALDTLYSAWAKGLKRPAIVLPTGAGKTVVFASLIEPHRELTITAETWTERPRTTELEEKLPVTEAPSSGRWG